MTDLYSDDLRLCSICFDSRLSGNEIRDLCFATSLGKLYGAVPPLDLEKKNNLVESIERVCDMLIKHAKKLAKLKADKVSSPSRHEKAVPASTISFLAWEMLIRCNTSGATPPVALLKLVRLQLGIRPEQDSREKNDKAMTESEAAIFLYLNPKTSLRDLAKRFDVNVSTISRWNGEDNNLKKRGKELYSVYKD